MSRPSLYLHIGHPKSGSTTLQNFLYQNWLVLKERGFEIPSPKLLVTHGSRKPGNPLHTLKTIRETGDIKPILSWIENARTTTPHTTKLILSSEFLASPGWATLLAPLAEICSIHLIYYIRRQDQLLLSAWRQWGLKRGLSLDELITRRLRNNQPNFSAIIKEWQEAIPLSSCRVRFLNSTFLEKGNLLEDFCLALGTTRNSLTRSEDKNLSYDGRLLHYVSRHPQLFKNPDDNRILKLLAGAADREPEVRAKLSEEQFEKIQAHFEPQNQILLADIQPNHGGTAVIERSTAPVFTESEDISLAAQNNYVWALLEQAGNKDDPLLQMLRATFSSQ